VERLAAALRRLTPYAETLGRQVVASYLRAFLVLVTAGGIGILTDVGALKAAAIAAFPAALVVIQAALAKLAERGVEL
jgi:hypothetical protein